MSKWNKNKTTFVGNIESKALREYAKIIGVILSKNVKKRLDDLKQSYENALEGNEDAYKKFNWKINIPHKSITLFIQKGIKSGKMKIEDYPTWDEFSKIIIKEKEKKIKAWQKKQNLAKKIRNQELENMRKQGKFKKMTQSDIVRGAKYDKDGNIVYPYGAGNE